MAERAASPPHRRIQAEHGGSGPLLRTLPLDMRTRGRLIQRKSLVFNWLWARTKRVGGSSCSSLRAQIDKESTSAVERGCKQLAGFALRCEVRHSSGTEERHRW